MKRVSKRFIVNFFLHLDDRLVLVFLLSPSQLLIQMVRKFQHRFVSVTHFVMIPNHSRGVFSCEEQLTTCCVAFLPQHTSRRENVLKSLYRDCGEFRCPRCREHDGAPTTHVTMGSSSILATAGCQVRSEPSERRQTETNLATSPPSSKTTLSTVTQDLFDALYWVRHSFLWIGQVVG